MSENKSPEAAVSDREVQMQAEKVNQLLRELEQQLDNTQHLALTELFAERAVLAAMRAQIELEELKKDRPQAGSTTATAPGPAPVPIPPTAPDKIENKVNEEQKGAGTL